MSFWGRFREPYPAACFQQLKAKGPKVDFSRQRPDSRDNGSTLRFYDVMQAMQKHCFHVSGRSIPPFGHLPTEFFLLKIDFGNLWSRQSRWSFQPS